MPHSTQTEQNPQPRRGSLLLRLGVCSVLLILCALASVQWLILESYYVPTGSMAPALRGRHRVCACPACENEVVVGRAAADHKGSGHPRYYRKAFCQACGHYPVPVAGEPEIAGDQVVVNKAAFLLRAPSRWEIIVFRLLGSFYIKRLLGLPGEEILLHDGDVYANGQLVRKSFDEVKRMRVLLIDHVGPGEPKSGRTGVSPVWSKTRRDAGPTLGSPGENKWGPIRDEQSYNGGVHAHSECVHDFSIDLEFAVAEARGSLSLRLCDGHDWVEVRLPIGTTGKLEAFAWPSAEREAAEREAAEREAAEREAAEREAAEREAPRKLGEAAATFAPRAGQRVRVEMAFVDRRLSVALDGRSTLCIDLPEAKQRGGVAWPLQIECNDAAIVLERLRLYRDVHYGQQGTNGVRGKSVRLGLDQYFFLGDNSPHSEDSRYWPDQGRVSASNLVGPVLFVRGASPERTNLRWLP